MSYLLEEADVAADVLRKRSGRGETDLCIPFGLLNVGGISTMRTIGPAIFAV